MTTLAGITLQVAKKINECRVLESAADGAGTDTTLIDSTLTFDDGYFEKGTIWPLSGAFAGLVAEVTVFKSDTFTFADLGVGATAAADRYAAARKFIPYSVLKLVVNQAFDDHMAKVTGVDNTSLTADGSTKKFTMPAAALDLVGVEFEDSAGNRWPSHHYRLLNGQLIFTRAPLADWDIILLYKKRHDVLTLYSDTIHAEINEDWLQWKAVELALKWAKRAYQDDPVLKLNEYLNEALEQLKGLVPRKQAFVIVHTAGG